jgi:hypothetical protein
LVTALQGNPASLDRAHTLVSAPKAEDYFETPLAEIANFDKKVTKVQAHRRNLANKYPRTELDRMNEQLEKYNLKKKGEAPATQKVSPHKGSL